MPIDDPVMELNRTIDSLSVPWGINESTIEAMLHQWEHHRNNDLPQYWLLAARLFEMAVLCAGHYVDHCEFTAAGDLLFNPRKILIYLKGSSHPLVKHRHGCLSGQLRHHRRAEDQPFPVWFRHTVAARVVEPAILPYLLQQLEQTGWMAGHYLRMARQRLEKAADAIAFLSAGSITSYEKLRSRIDSASCETPHFIFDHLCLFDHHLLNALGEEIRNACSDPYHRSKFITHRKHEHKGGPCNMLYRHCCPKRSKVKGEDYDNPETEIHHPFRLPDSDGDHHCRSCL